MDKGGTSETSGGASEPVELQLCSVFNATLSLGHQKVLQHKSF